MRCCRRGDWLWMAILIGLSILAPGCERNPAAKALDSDANGYVCRGCKEKFYTDRLVFANQCPACKSHQLAEVVGFVCPADKHVTIAPRGTGSMACEQCGQTTPSIRIPREADFKAWGAPKKSAAEVGS